MVNGRVTADEVASSFRVLTNFPEMEIGEVCLVSYHGGYQTIWAAI